MEGQCLSRVYGMRLLAKGGLALWAIALCVPEASANPPAWSKQPSPPSASSSPTWKASPVNHSAPQWQDAGQPATAPSSPSWTAPSVSPSLAPPSLAPHSSSGTSNNGGLPRAGAIATTYFDHQAPLRLSPSPKRTGINATQISSSPATPPPLSNTASEAQPLSSPPSATSQDSLAPSVLPPVIPTPPNGESIAPENSVPEPTPSESLENPSPEIPIPKLSTTTQYSPTPLQLPPTQLINLETANVLPAGSVLTTIGAHLFPKDQAGAGTGLQTYNISIAGGITDRFQLGLDWVLFDDTLGQSFQDGIPDLGLMSFAPNVKYQFLKEAKFSLAVVGSLEIGKFTGRKNHLKSITIKTSLIHPPTS